METAHLIAKMLDMNNGITDMALEGLPDEKLNESPNAESNPVGWLIWHKTRVEDAAIAHATGKPQAWVDQDWGKKFGTESAPGDIGFGYPMDKVRSMKFTKEDLLGYVKAVRKRTNAALASLSPADLDREIPDFLPDNTIRLGEFLGRALLVDNFHHSGKTCYLRGFHTGFGWLPY